MAFVALSMGKEGWDDYRRYKLDKVENRSDAWVLDPAKTVKGNVKTRTAAVRDRLRRRQENVGGEMGMEDLAAADDAAEDLDSWSKGNPDVWSKVQWQHLRVGDVVRLRRDEDVPADIILLHATGPNGIAYIETMALDGETNLKSKQASPLLAKHCHSHANMTSCTAEIVSEDPNLDLYNYEGKVILNEETMPLTLNQVVYRGSTLRNTDQAIGLVINSGEECKIRMNAHKNVHAKAPAMQSVVNKIVMILVVFVIMLSLGCTVGNLIWKGDVENSAWYLDGGAVPFGQVIVAFIIAFNTLIPLSLYVSLEIIKIGQFILMQDVEMYDPKTDTPMVVNTTTILENLGQVSYVFSDKTGTLTENLMRFRKMSVAGTAWLHDMDVRRDAEDEEKNAMKRRLEAKKYLKGKEKQLGHPSGANTPTSDLNMQPETTDASQKGGRQSSEALPRRSSSQWKSTARPSHAQPELKTDDLIQYIRQKPNTTFSRKARQFILCIALCHTCLPETKENGDIEFQAASPDELALVEAARDLGFLLIDRPAQAITLQFQDIDGSPMLETYEVLDVIEFSSKRKRMSIVIRMPDGRICIFSKGADSVILPRLKLSQLAIKKASAVERKASMRKSMEQERALRRLSMQGTPRNSMNLGRASSTLTQRRSMIRRGSAARSTSIKRSSMVTDGMDTWLRSRETEGLETESINDEAYQSPRPSIARQRSFEQIMSPVEDVYDGMVDESLAINEGAVFEHCFQHIDDFASEGLRTLLFAFRYLDEDEYKKWKTIYHEATTSLFDRQDRIESAAELIEQNFDLAGVTAIEDKLQQGVPDTIDKLRRANIKVWMLTGDKRETAINIAHSARICKPFSETYILDATQGDLNEKIAASLVDVGRGMIPHSVVVIDGHTLSVVEDDESLKILFFDLVSRVDSVICCRASPSQKATLVKCIRTQVPSSLTLAIGDGANDIAMIQASHVGIGISGREGLQAARISDYSIAQFRFLQKLLFVHGRWNYIRTGKYILGTFWKEVVFYLTQAMYQRYNGYTGTSLYESASLTVFNTLFTSLPVILLGIFEQDLRAETLLAVPELYTYGQRGLAFNFKKYVAWMIMAVSEAALIYYMIHSFYDRALSTDDTSLYAMGDLSFTVCVIFINIKMLVLEYHNKTIIPFVGLIVSVGGWFLWNIFLSAIYARAPGPYIVRDAFLHNFGKKPTWWLTVLLTLLAVLVLELVVTGIRRVFWPRDQDLMQEIEHCAGVMDVLKEHAAERGEASAAEAGPNGGVTMVADDAASLKSATTRLSRRSGVIETRVVELETPSKRRSRVSMELTPRAFTPPAEEREDAASPENRRTKPRDLEVSTKSWVGEMASSSEPTYVQSPIEMQSTELPLKK
ncbi:putative p-type atpase protein [Phaeoacremonium minimum UCRPA7]|uniref:Phospholipid-transporting ATPase n=1 Tax=Phaeoacremonium minimum (strain UCR-PA7) TaxID=1286976 RepID=R8BEG2_PHAM7|nr:putative p-type atpase protein [Phaeoacremonium minimum UCRPA7]EON97691.1 putative p-type atpase protein [Phaeoacremonium minimum UCRPA7]